MSPEIKDRLKEYWRRYKAGEIEAYQRGRILITYTGTQNGLTITGEPVFRVLKRRKTSGQFFKYRCNWCGYRGGVNCISPGETRCKGHAD